MHSKQQGDQPKGRTRREGGREGGKEEEEGGSCCTTGSQQTGNGKAERKELD